MCFVLTVIWYTVIKAFSIKAIFSSSVSSCISLAVKKPKLKSWNCEDKWVNTALKPFDPDLVMKQCVLSHSNIIHVGVKNKRIFNKDSIFFNLFLSVVESSKWKQLPGRFFVIASICLILHVWFVFIFHRTLYWLLQSSWTWLSCARFVSESSSKWLVIMNSSLFTQSSPFSVTFWRPHLSLKALQLSTPSSSKGTALKTYSGKNSNVHGFLWIY